MPIKVVKISAEIAENIRASLRDIIAGKTVSAEDAKRLAQLKATARAAQKA
jgi:hypothetical protein